AEALAAARDAQPMASPGVDPREPNGLAAGMDVTVTPDDYGFDPVAGTLVASSVDEIAIRRSDPAVGTVVVHFPRFGFRVARRTCPPAPQVASTPCRLGGSVRTNGLGRSGDCLAIRPPRPAPAGHRQVEARRDPPTIARGAHRAAPASDGVRGRGSSR